MSAWVVFVITGVAFVVGLLGVYAWLRGLSMLMRQQDMENKR